MNIFSNAMAPQDLLTVEGHDVQLGSSITFGPLAMKICKS